VVLHFFSKCIRNLHWHYVHKENLDRNPTFRFYEKNTGIIALEFCFCVYSQMVHASLFQPDKNDKAAHKTLSPSVQSINCHFLSFPHSLGKMYNEEKQQSAKTIAISFMVRNIKSLLSFFSQ
jgi:hypothetical protein